MTVLYTYAVIGNVKKIYGYRSAIIHSSHKVEKHRVIKKDSKNPVEVVPLAERHLRDLLQILINEPKYFLSSECRLRTSVVNLKITT